MDERSEEKQILTFAAGSFGFRSGGAVPVHEKKTWIN